MTITDDRRRVGVDPSDRWSAHASIVHLSGVQAVTRSIIDTLRADALERASNGRIGIRLPGFPARGLRSRAPACALGDR